MFDVVMTQYHVSKGLKIFGEPGAQAMLKELKQLDQHEVMIPRHSESLTEEQRKAALPYLMFLKKKRCGKIKG